MRRRNLAAAMLSDPDRWCDLTEGELDEDLRFRELPDDERVESLARSMSSDTRSRWVRRERA